MNILLATPFIEPESGGPAAIIQGLEGGLAERGHHVSVAANRNRTALATWRRFSPDGESVIHNFGLWAPLNHQVSVLARRRRLPHVFAPMGMLEPWTLAHKKWKKRAGWWGYQRRDLVKADCLNATAREELEHIRDAGLRLPVALIPYGLNIPETQDIGRSVRHGPLRLLFLSRIHAKKGLLNWVEASQSLADRDWEAVIAGPDEGGYRKAVEAALVKAGLADRFTFTGPVYGAEEKAALFASADVFVLPSHSENFGIVIAEALAHGLPVITTTATPWASLVTEGAGWWVPPSAEGIAEALDAALALDRAQLATLGARGRALVAREYGWSVIIDKHLALYAWMLGQGTKPDFVQE